MVGCRLIGRDCWLTWRRSNDRQLNVHVEVLELTLHDDARLVMGARDSKGEAGEPWING